MLLVFHLTGQQPCNYSWWNDADGKRFYLLLNQTTKFTNNKSVPWLAISGSATICGLPGQKPGHPNFTGELLTFASPPTSGALGSTQWKDPRFWRTDHRKRRSMEKLRNQQWIAHITNQLLTGKSKLHNFTTDSGAIRIIWTQAADCNSLSAHTTSLSNIPPPQQTVPHCVLQLRCIRLRRCECTSLGTHLYRCLSGLHLWTRQNSSIM